MKTKFVLGLAMVGMALATAHSAKAAFSVDISVGSRFPRPAPVVIAPQAPPVVYSPAPVDNCPPQVVSYPPPVVSCPPEVSYPAPVVVAPPPQVIVTRPIYRDDHRYAYRHDEHRHQRVVYRRPQDDHRGRW
jgi:hypothetical protein